MIAVQELAAALLQHKTCVREDGHPCWCSFDSYAHTPRCQAARDAMTLASIPIDVVRRFRIAPGDIAVIEISGHLSSDEAARLSEQWTRMFPEARLAVLDNGAKLAAVLAPIEARMRGL